MLLFFFKLQDSKQAKAQKEANVTELSFAFYNGIFSKTYSREDGKSSEIRQ